MCKEEMVFENKMGKRYFPSEVVFCDIDTPGPQFMGYVTLDSFNSTDCIDRWEEVRVIPNARVESQSIPGGSIVKGVKHHKES